MTAFRSDRGKHMITLSCTKRWWYMVLTGVWIGGSNVTEPILRWHFFKCLCVCVCVCVCALHPNVTVWFHSILAVSVGGLLFIVHTACNPSRSLSCARSLGVWRERGLSTEHPRRNQQRGAPSDRSQLHFSRSEDWWRWSSLQWEYETSGPQRLITP